MQVNQIPFNLELLLPTDEDVRNITPVTVADINVAGSRNFHPDGLFSTEIFGKVGEEKRNRTFSYIDIKIPIFHPLIFKAIVDLKRLYGDIMKGSKYAVFDETLKDFVASTPDDGFTGYEFFVSRFDDLVFEERPSPARTFNINLIKKYKDNLFITKLVVMPAGLRDYFIDDSGKPTEDEINSIYRRILAMSLIFRDIDIKGNITYLDAGRYNIQVAVRELYLYIKTLIEGKGKLIQGKWATRAIFNSTRNVITSYIVDSNGPDDPKVPSTNQSIVGLYQYMRMTLPLTVKGVRENYLSDVFIGPNSPAKLIDKKTLKTALVNIDSKTYDSWMSYEGIEKQAAKFGMVDFRHKPVEIEGYYLALIYKGTDGTIKVFYGIEDLPDNLDKKQVFPITYAELFYLSVMKGSSEIPCLITRYPITGYGSVYPSYVYLKTTVKGDIKVLLDDNWNESDIKAYEFPITDGEFFDSLTVSIAHLNRLGGDYDGDKG